jgi:hypothetical protein
MWMDETWATVSEVSQSAYLGVKGKSSKRQLTKADVEGLESVKLNVFTNLPPLKKIEASDVVGVLRSGVSCPRSVKTLMKEHGVSIEAMGIDGYKKSVMAICLELLLDKV